MRRGTFLWNWQELQGKSVRETLWAGDIRYDSRLYSEKAVFKIRNKLHSSCGQTLI